MISLLIAIFGKDRIPNSLRYALLTFGISMLAYKLYLFRKVQREIKEAQAIQQVIEQRVAKGEAPPITPPVAQPAPQVIQA
jgi:hypothetical protein